MGRLALVQVCLGALLPADVLEQNGDAAELWFADAECVDAVPTAEYGGLLLETARYARKRNLPVDSEPVLFVRGCEAPHPTSNGVVQACLLLEGRVHVEECVVDRSVAFVEQHLDRAIPHVDRLEQEPIMTVDERRRFGAVRVLQLVTCAVCGGSGRAAVGCERCGGSGRVEVEREAEVTIPSGVENGARVPVGPDGEHVVVRVQPQPRDPAALRVAAALGLVAAVAFLAFLLLS